MSTKRRDKYIESKSNILPCKIQQLKCNTTINTARNTNEKTNRKFVLFLRFSIIQVFVSVRILFLIPVLTCLFVCLLSYLARDTVGLRLLSCFMFSFTLNLVYSIVFLFLFNNLLLSFAYIQFKFFLPFLLAGFLNCQNNDYNLAS